MYKNFSVNLLKKEMHYHPPWYNDKSIFFKLLNKKVFSPNDYILFSRLYIRYSHVNTQYLNEYFHIILNKTNKKNIDEILTQARNYKNHKF